MCKLPVKNHSPSSLIVVSDHFVGIPRSNFLAAQWHNVIRCFGLQLQSLHALNFGKNTHHNIFVLNLPVPSSFLQVDAHIDAQGITLLYSAVSIAIYSYIIYMCLCYPLSAMLIATFLANLATFLATFSQGARCPSNGKRSGHRGISAVAATPRGIFGGPKSK